MKKIYCVICRKYRKPEKPEISCLLEKASVFSITRCKCKNEGKKLFKELKIIGLTESI